MYGELVTMILLINQLSDPHHRPGISDRTIHYSLQLQNSYITRCRYIFYKSFMVITKTIAISVENYDRLKKYGFAGQSLNQAISNLLAAVREKSD